MMLKDVMDPIGWYEYVSGRKERGLDLNEERPPLEGLQLNELPPRKVDYKNVLDSIQYYEYMLGKEKD